MTTEAFIELMKQVGIGAALLVVVGVALWRGAKFIGRIVEKFFEGLIDELKAVRKSIEEHAKADRQDHADARETIAGFDSKLDTILDERERTPVEGVPVRGRTNPRGVPIGEYGPRRGKTHGDDR